MDMDNAKLFVGGISRETSEDTLRAHFSKYGDVLGSLVAKEKDTKVPRGFGFVWFSDPNDAHRALEDSHVILGRTVEVKRAIPRGEQPQVVHHQRQFTNQHKNISLGENSCNDNGNDYFRTKKIFVGGLSSTLTEEQFKNYFERFGKIVDVVVMQDNITNRPRGFGFVTFDSEESVDEVMKITFRELHGRLVEVKRAVPKEELSGTNNSYITKGSMKGPAGKSFHHGNYLPYVSPGYEIVPGYVPFPGYNGCGWPSYDISMYGGYPMPMVGYLGPSMGVTAVAPRSCLRSPVMVGPVPGASAYNNPFIYPFYMDGGASSYGGIVGRHENGSGGNGGQPIEGVKLGVDSSNGDGFR